jgi:hypothetical protein
LANVGNVLSGPASALFDDQATGHTQGGIKSTVSPKNRARKVDKYGDGECDYIHLGDEVRITIPFAEFQAAELGTIYAAGSDQTAATGAKFLGIGRSAGFIYADADLKIVPLLTADAAKKIQFFRVVPIGSIEQMFKAEDDRILSMEFAALVDEAATDGALIGKMFLTAS